MKNFGEILVGRTKPKEIRKEAEGQPNFVEMFKNPRVRQDFIEKIEEISRLVVAKDPRTIDILRKTGITNPLKVLDSFIKILEQKNDALRAMGIVKEGINIAKLLKYQKEILELVEKPKEEIVVREKSSKGEKTA